MTELPKFVLHRLAVSPAAVEHPPADQLAAFVEQQLAGAEREKLLAHLASCHSCREAIWHSLPEAGASQPIIIRAARPSFWIPSWRWVGMAAAAVVIATVGLVYRGGPGAAGAKFASTPKPPAVTAEGAQTLAANAPRPAALPQPQRKAPVPKIQMEAKAVPLKSKLAEREQASANQLASAEKPVQAADAVTGAAARAVAGGAGATEARDSAINATAPALSPVPASATAPGVMVGSAMPALVLGKKKLAPPTLWMLSADGHLLRSTDSGKNWQSVPFEDKVLFRAVAVVGPRVWAGGVGGALYYSSDDGSQWTRLAPSESVPLTEDIRALVFQDGRHGNLTTASGQSWSTTDGGHSWHKQ